jgi:hypothetical protein
LVAEHGGKLDDRQQSRIGLLGDFHSLSHVIGVTMRDQDEIRFVYLFGIGWGLRVAEPRINIDGFSTRGVDAEDGVPEVRGPRFPGGRASGGLCHHDRIGVGKRLSESSDGQRAAAGEVEEVSSRQTGVVTLLVRGSPALWAGRNRTLAGGL